MCINLNLPQTLSSRNTRENNECTRETSDLENTKIRKSGASVPPVGPPVRTPRDPPGGKTGGNLSVGAVVHRKITSDGSWTCTTTKGLDGRTTSQSSNVPESRDFQLVAFREQTGGRFGRFGGAPRRPPVSSPPRATRAKRIGGELQTTVDFKIFRSVGLEGGWFT